MTDSGPSFYQYKPLPSEKFVRLIELYPGHTNEDIACTLRQTRLEDAPKYEAISYAWGDPANKINLLCDGKIITVTPNLKDALHRFKFKDRSRILWADAICINQKDEVEKGLQVKMMARIYGNATTVCVWLGCTNAQLQPAFEFLDTIVGHTSAAGIDSAKLRNTSSECWSALDVFFSAAWFHRLWVIQEVYSHVCTVFCSEYEIQWKDLVLVARWLSELSRTENHPSRNLAHIANAISVSAINSPLKHSTSGIFDLFRHFKCTDQRDKVYALLSFPPLCDLHPPIQPDYSKSVAEVFEEATIRVFTSCQNLGLLSGLEHGSTIDEEWPSWVPRWDRHRTTQILHNYASGRAQSSVPHIKYCPKILISEGLRISRLSWCGVVIGREVDEPEIDPVKQPFQEWLLKYFPKITHSTDPLLLSIAMTLTVGLDLKSNCPPLDLSQFRLDFLAYMTMNFLPSLDMLSTNQRLIQSLMTEAMAGISSNFYRAAFRGCRNKRFFCTENGEFGIGPVAAQPGDYIILLYGSNAPCLLRATGPHYQFVGECYLHEHMHGEAIKMAAAQLLDIEEFTIK